MEVGGVFFSTNAKTVMKTGEALANFEKYEEKVEAEENASSTAVKQDTFTKSEEQVSSDSGIYSKETIQKTVEQMEEQRAAAMQSMIRDMLGEQAKAAGLKYFGPDKTLSLSDITQEDIDEAKKSIEDGGYWSVDSVATRIMDMAKLLAGNDPSKLSMLKDSVIKGFGGAAELLGKSGLDDMPDITRQTYDEVMKRFDDWETELGGTQTE
ncbi:MAG: hypothetical protein IJM75_06840 [Ruminococcus sp.]|nr:hypothetical protein [Ruminococcus sp.]